MSFTNKVWNLKSLFLSDTDPAIVKTERAAQKAVANFVKQWSARHDYTESPAVMATALAEYEQLLTNGGLLARSYLYWHLRSAQNQNDAAVKARLLQTQELAEKLQNSIRFFLHAIKKIPPRQQNKFLSNPGLQPYRHLLERQFRQGAHTLSIEAENILALKESTSYTQWTQLTEECLAKETRNSHPLPVLMSQLNDHRQTVRDRAARGVNDILASYAPIATAELNAVLAHKKTEDELRGFTRPDASRHLQDDINSTVVDALVDAVSARNNIAHRLYQLKARLWNKSQLLYHERNLLLPTVEPAKKYPAALKIVEQTFAQLDPEFGQLVRRFATEGRIDVYPRPGKDGGAFCSYWSANLPVYVMLNHTDRLRDTLVIAHELGHGLNGEYMRAQSELNYDSPTSTAEVASTFFEDFVLQELLKSADDKTRLSLMLQQLSDEVSTIHRQIALYKFEQALHADFRQAGYLDTAAIGKLFNKHMTAYMGPAVEQSKGCDNWWIHWSHIRYYFYVYSYASGLLISKTLQAAVKKDPHFINQVKTFLSAGTTKSPQELFMDLGLDISKKTFWNSGLNEIEQHLEAVTKLATQLKMI